MSFTKNNYGFFVSDDQLADLSYPEIGNEDCFAIEDNSQWFQARNRTLYSMMKEYPFVGDFIDIGGGNGYQINKLRNLGISDGNWILCEPGSAGCINAASRGVHYTYNCSYEDFPYEEYNIGAVGLFDVIEHIEDPLLFLKGILEKVKTGTKIYITVPALQNLWSEVDEYAGHFKRYNYQDADEFTSLLSVKLEYKSYFFSYYVPFLYGLRVLPEKLGFKQTHEQIKLSEMSNHKSNSLITWLLNGLHKKELSSMLKGSKLKYGTSLLMVFTKE